MRLRECLERPDPDEFGNGEDVGSVVTDGEGPTPQKPDQVWPFVRETRIRMIQVETRLALMTKIIVGGFVALFTTIIGALILQILLL